MRLVWLPVVAMPAFAVIVGATWADLPGIMSVHFSAAREPDGTMSRAVFALQGLLFLAMPAAAGAVLLKTRPLSSALLSCALLAAVYGITAGTFTILWEIVRFNQQLSGPPRPPAAAAAALLAGAVGYALATRLRREGRQ